MGSLPTSPVRDCSKLLTWMIGSDSPQPKGTTEPKGISGYGKGQYPHVRREHRQSGGGGGGDDGLDSLSLDPPLIALLKNIPTSGEWPAVRRVRWFRTFAMNVSQIYDGDNEPVEMKINLDKEAAN